MWNNWIKNFKFKLKFVYWVFIRILFIFSFSYFRICVQIRYVSFSYVASRCLSSTNIFMTLVLTSVPKLAILVLVIKFHILFFQDSQFFLNKIWLISVIFSIVIGTFGAFYQTSILRFWAYSAITHIAMIMCNFIVLNWFSFLGALVYMLIYLLITFNFFLVFILFSFTNLIIWLNI